jgi:hypothetical protein
MLIYIIKIIKIFLNKKFFMQVQHIINNSIHIIDNSTYIIDNSIHIIDNSTHN